MGELPRQPDEVTLEELLRLARILKEHPENRPGADKTWVLDSIRSMQAFFREARQHGRWLTPDEVDAGASRVSSESAQPGPLISPDHSPNP